jgi:hypothetical protein
MKKVNNNLAVFATMLFLSTLFFSCVSEASKSNNLNSSFIDQDSRNIASSSSDIQDSTIILFPDSIHFQIVKQYIKSIGEHERVSASAIAGDTNWMVEYYSISRGDWKITIDHTKRIYFSFKSYSHGNILLEDNSVHVEPYYIGPREDIDTLIDIVFPITTLYNTLVQESSEQ